MISPVTDPIPVEGDLSKNELFRYRQIRSISAARVKNEIQERYRWVVDAEDYVYGRGRGAGNLLEKGRDYAELPGFEGKTPKQIIEDLKSGDNVLDVGCGYGEFGSNILRD